MRRRHIVAESPNHQRDRIQDWSTKSDLNRVEKSIPLQATARKSHYP